jgi:hypothetical protein
VASVTSVGMAVGFSEASAFWTAFRKATGVTPRAFSEALNFTPAPDVYRGCGRALWTAGVAPSPIETLSSMLRALACACCTAWLMAI